MGVIEAFNRNFSISGWLPKLAIAGLIAGIGWKLAADGRAIAGNIGRSLVTYSQNSDPEGSVLETQLYNLSRLALSAPRDLGQGGAIEAFADDVVLVTRRGGFFRLNEEAEGFEPMVWAPPAPIVEEGFYTRAKDNWAVGYQDLKLRRLQNGGIEIFLSETRPDIDRNCATLVVYRATIADPSLEVALDASDWTRLWRSSPCIKRPEQSFPLQAGGEMTFEANGNVAVFVGDFGNDEFNRDAPGAEVQNDNSDYGKVISIDPQTRRERTVSKGHRNPGGITTRPNGEIWLAENAAEGGDEINRIVEGGNYGWPVRTYTTHYGMKSWPAATDERLSGHVRPAYAFVPSPAVSSMAAMTGSEFPSWKGDLILGTLKAQRIYRVHVADGDVILTEPIDLGFRVRDLTVDAQGRIYLKADNRAEVIRLGHAAADWEAKTPGLLALKSAGCLSCHAGWNKAAPGLDGVIGRKVASYPGFQYSRGLTQLGGKWTRRRLEAFLRDPQTVAPGTTMPARDLSEEEIDKLVEAMSAAE